MLRNSLALCLLGGGACVFIRRLRDDEGAREFLRDFFFTPETIVLAMSWVGVALFILFGLLSLLVFNSQVPNAVARRFHALTVLFIVFWGAAAWLQNNRPFPEPLASVLFYAGWPERWIAALVVALLVAGCMSIGVTNRRAILFVSVVLSALFAVYCELAKPGGFWWSLTQAVAGVVGAGHYWVYHQKCVPFLRFWSERPRKSLPLRGN